MQYYMKTQISSLDVQSQYLQPLNLRKMHLTKEALMPNGLWSLPCTSALYGVTGLNMNRAPDP